MADNHAHSKQKTLLGHPLGLYTLFFTEMWERFSFYGMKALLLLYMVEYLVWDQILSGEANGFDPNTDKLWRFGGLFF